MQMPFGQVAFDRMADLFEELRFTDYTISNTRVVFERSGLRVYLIYYRKRHFFCLMGRKGWLMEIDDAAAAEVFGSDIPLSNLSREEFFDNVERFLTSDGQILLDSQRGTLHLLTSYWAERAAKMQEEAQAAELEAQKEEASDDEFEEDLEEVEPELAEFFEFLDYRRDSVRRNDPREPVVPTPLQFGPQALDRLESLFGRLGFNRYEIGPDALRFSCRGLKVLLVHQIEQGTSHLVIRDLILPPVVIDNIAVREVFESTIPIERLPMNLFLENVAKLFLDKGDRLMENRLAFQWRLQMLEAKKRKRDWRDFHNATELQYAEEAWKERDYRGFIYFIDNLKDYALPQSMQMKYDVAKERAESQDDSQTESHSDFSS